jgi:hypothetical protein
VQTFLPYPSFRRTAACLDYRRLGKQRVESVQILAACRHATIGWRNHPATLMWRGYEPALEQYLRHMICEWKRRGYFNTIPCPVRRQDIVLPPWFGDDSFHASHRAALLAKDPEWYGQFGWTEDPIISYVWPVVKGG